MVVGLLETPSFAEIQTEDTQACCMSVGPDARQMITVPLYE